jgi:hypothetical protein
METPKSNLTEIGFSNAGWVGEKKGGGLWFDMKIKSRIS